MSLINDVLRDIDRRGIQPGRHASVAIDDTVVVPPLRARRWPPSWLMIAAVAALLGSLAAYLLLGLGGGISRAVPDPAELAAARAAPGVTAPPAPADDAADTGETAGPTPETRIDAAHMAPTMVDAARQTASATQAAATDAAADSVAPSTAHASIDSAPSAIGPAPHTPASLAAPGVYILPGKRVNLRDAPALDSAVLHVLSARSPLTLLGEAQGFLQVRTADGTTGWISAAYARVGAPAPDTADTTAPAAPAPVSAVEPSPAAQSGGAPHAVRSPPAESAAALHTEALRALERGNPAAAEAALLKALQFDPPHAPSVTALAALLLQQERRGDLEAQLGTLAARSATDTTAAVLLARLQAERGALDAALQTLGGLPEDALDGAQLAVLATLRQRSGQHAAAIETYRRALARGARPGTTWAGLAVSLDALGRAADARAAWEAALAAGPLDAALERHARSRLAALRGTGD